VIAPALRLEGRNPSILKTPTVIASQLKLQPISRPTPGAQRSPVAAGSLPEPKGKDVLVASRG
jgi:hypothetical protein